MLPNSMNTTPHQHYVPLSPWDSMCAARRGHFLTASQPYAKGTCYTYLVQEGDNCIDLAVTYSITVDDILSYNNNTWGCWMI
jgi:hypothetical protein